MKNIFFALSVIALASSCSHQEEKAPQEKVYSQETNDFFDRIEKSKNNTFRNRVYNIENNSIREREGRNDNINSNESLENLVIQKTPTRYQPDSRPPKRRAEIQESNKKLIDPQAPERAAYRLPKPEQIKAPTALETNEAVIEIEQITTYFCMDKKKLVRFNNDQTTCENYTLKVLKTCMNGNKKVSKSTANCVSTKLKKG